MKTPTSGEQARLREFVQALKEEIAALQQNGGGSSTSVYDGRFNRREGEFFVYVFTIENPLIVVDDAPAKIKVGNEEFDGQIVSIQGSEVAVGIKRDFHTTIPEAKLIINRWFLLEALRKRYEEVLSGQRELNTHLAQLLFKSSSANSVTDQNDLNLPSSANPPNDDQLQAIRAVCGSDIHFIWGPPGTGKTQTIGFLVAVLLRRGLRVLIVAHTNVATDNAIARAAELLEGTEDYQSGKLVRFGNVSTTVVLPEMVILDKIIERLGEQQKKQIKRLREQLAPVRTELDCLRSASERLSRRDESQKDLGKLETNLQSCVHERENLQAREKELILGLEDAKTNLTDAQAAGKLKRFFRGLDPVKLQNHVSRLQIDLNAIRDAVSANLTKRNQIQTAIERKVAEIECCGTKCRSCFLATASAKDLSESGTKNSPNRNGKSQSKFMQPNANSVH